MILFDSSFGGPMIALGVIVAVRWADLRVNEWISVVACVVAIGFIATGRLRRRPDQSLDETEQPVAVKE